MDTSLAEKLASAPDRSDTMEDEVRRLSSPLSPQVIAGLIVKPPDPTVTALLQAKCEDSDWDTVLKLVLENAGASHGAETSWNHFDKLAVGLNTVVSFSRLVSLASNLSRPTDSLYLLLAGLASRQLNNMASDDRQLGKQLSRVIPNYKPGLDSMINCQATVNIALKLIMRGEAVPRQYDEHLQVLFAGGLAVIDKSVTLEGSPEEIQKLGDFVRGLLPRVLVEGPMETGLFPILENAAGWISENIPQDLDLAVVSANIANSGDSAKRFVEALLKTPGACTLALDIIRGAPSLTSLIAKAPVSDLLDWMQTCCENSIASQQLSQRPDSGEGLTLQLAGAFDRISQQLEVPSDKLEQFRNVQFLCLRAFPRIINWDQGHNDILLDTERASPIFSEDVEAEMRTCFQEMYEQQYEIREVIAMLERLKHSPAARDQDLFACMVHSLFDEYRFFPDYPVNALATTAVLFGSLVHFRLIDGIPLSIALRYILESLRQPVESNMFRFGLQALFELRQRLPEFPKYCSVLMAIPGLASQQHFFAQIKAIVEPEVDDHEYRSISTVVAGVDQLGPVTEPPEDLKNKILFAVNNLSAKTVETKAQDLSPLLRQKLLLRWFAQYLVGRSVGEPNYHGLYISLISAIRNQLLELCCLQVIYQRVHSLLIAQDGLTSDKRTQLKNLGAFLGELTLARNRPVLRSNLNLSLLLAEAHKREWLAAVLPFVCKILAGAANSKVFGVQTPWLKSQLAVLSELYNNGGLKLNLKFEIEVLGNTLAVAIAQIPPADYIENIAAQQADLQQVDELEMDIDRLSLVDPAASAGVQSGIPPVSALAAAGPLPPGTPQPPVQGQTLQQPLPSVQVVGTTDFATHPTLRPILELAISKTLQEVLLPVVDRSASIASFTAKELILKDFAAEPDETKLQKASHTVSSVLATAMALITAKDPFVDSLIANIRTLLATHGIGERSLLDQVPLAAKENIESIIPLVESIASDKAIAEVDDALMSAYNLRQRTRLSGGQLPAPRTPPVGLPDLLRTRVGGLSLEQSAIYDQFSLSPTQGGLGTAVPQSPEQALLQMQSGLENIVKLCAKSPVAKLSDLSGDDPVVMCLTQILSYARATLTRGDDGVLKASQLVIQYLFSGETQLLLIESLCYALAQLCQLSPITAREVMIWLLYADDDRKFSGPVVSTLLQSRLVAPSDLDASLAKDVLQKKAKATPFAARLVLMCILGPNPFCLRADFAATLEALVASDDPSAKVACEALKKARADSAESLDAESLGHIFAEWARLSQSPAATPQMLDSFVNELLLNFNSSSLLRLVRAALEVSVESYTQVQSTAGLDSLAKLISVLLSSTEERETFFRNCLTIVVLVLAREHEAEKDMFNGRSYFRFFSTMASLIAPDLTLILAEVLETLQPTAFPGFTAPWIALVSHRFIMGRLLADSGRGWTVFTTLLESLLQTLRYQETAQVMSLTVRAIERILLVVLHDCPEIFIRNHISLVAAMPQNYTQLRNIILCAFPAESDGLSDPLSTPIDNESTDEWLEESARNAEEVLTDMDLKRLVEQTLRSPTPQAIVNIANALTLDSAQSLRHGLEGVTHSVLGMGALAVYLSMNSSDDENRESVLFTARLLSSLPTSGRYYLLSSIANQLRYPSAPTTWASNILLTLFLPNGERLLRENAPEIRQIATRVLLERVVCHRPHPWGLMATVATLLRMPAYRFWDLPFLKTTPELEQMFSALYSRIVPTQA